MKKICVLMSLLLLCITPPSFADVITNDAVLSPDGTFGDYSLTLTTSIPVGEGAFFLTFDYDGSDIYSFSLIENTYSIAERMSIRLAPYGTFFTPEYVSSTPALFDNISPSNWQTTIPLNSSVYLAYWDDRVVFDSTPTPNDLYGWIQLTHTLSGLEGSSSATARGNGIVVGTVTQIPEPTTMALCIIGCFGLLRCIRKKNESKPNKASEFTFLSGAGQK